MNVIIIYLDLYICDIGIAKKMKEGDDQKLMTQMIGTPYYMAPEILGGNQRFK